MHRFVFKWILISCSNHDVTSKKSARGWYGTEWSGYFVANYLLLALVINRGDRGGDHMAA